MEQTYVASGTVENGRLIHLDEPLPISDERVSVVVRLAVHKDRNGKTLFEWLDKIHAHRKKLGIKSLTKEEVDTWIQEERGSWGD